MPPRHSFSSATSFLHWLRLGVARYKVLVGASLICALIGGAGLAAPACAQSTSASASGQNVFVSSGLRATVTGAKQESGHIYLQFLLSNLTNQRQYVVWLGRSSAALGSGPILPTNNVTGLAFCPNAIGFDNVSAFHYCMKTYQSDLDDASYIEPQQYIAVTVVFNAPDSSASVSDDTLSYTLQLLAHAVPTEDQALEASADGKSVEPARLIDISIPLVAINQ